MDKPYAGRQLWLDSRSQWNPVTVHWTQHWPHSRQCTRLVERACSGLCWHSFGFMSSLFSDPVQSTGHLNPMTFLIFFCHYLIWLLFPTEDKFPSSPPPASLPHTVQLKLSKLHIQLRPSKQKNQWHQIRKKEEKRCSGLASEGKVQILSKQLIIH